MSDSGRTSRVAPGSRAPAASDRAAGSRLPAVQSGEIRRLVSDLAEDSPVREERFDRLLAQPWRVASMVHWTPLHVCQRVVRLLAPGPGERVLDVGSGVGKLCVIGSLTTQAVFVGVEQRAHLVLEAERVARTLGAARAEFVHGNAFALDWSPYRGLYFYNPFGEMLLDGDLAIDGSIRVGAEAYEEYIAATRARLGQMPLGTRVALYHGFGGDLPPSYEMVSSEWLGNGTLELWVRSAS